MPLIFKAWLDHNISWDSLPTTIDEVGKEVVSHRDVALSAAVHALKEASAADGVIRCMRLFVEVCRSSEKDCEGALVERFLNLYHSMEKARMVIDALLTRGSSLTQEAGKSFATSWVEAAVETHLSKFCLFKDQDRNGEKCPHYAVLENTQSSFKKSSPPHNNQSSTKGVQSPSRRHTEKMNTDWSKGGSGLKVVASLAEKLLLISREWFLNYLEGFLEKGLGLTSADGGASILLGQLKRVNQWLDDKVGDGSERIDGLKKKLYGFLLEHVDSTTVALE